MSIKTVKVPKSFEPLFKKAQQYVQKYFKALKSNPNHGTIEIFGQRYIFVRAASMSVEFFDLVKRAYEDRDEQEAIAIARNLLFDIAHAIGAADAKEFHKRMRVKDPIAKLSAGPIHFAYSGWAFVDIHPESHPSPDENYFLVYDHPYSFESDSWKRAKRKVDFPVCVMNAGYSSGWCQESFGIELVATEITCKAKGDKHCRFIMAHPAKIEEHLKRYSAEHRATDLKLEGYEIPGFFSRKTAEAELRKTLGELDERIAEKTGPLERANAQLRREIEERIRSEAALAQSEEKYRKLIDTASDAIFVADVETGIVQTVNQKAQEMIGLPAEHIVGMHQYQLHPPEQAAFYEKIFKQFGETGSLPPQDLFAQHRSGRKIPIEISASLCEINGRMCIQGVFRDITAQKQKQQELEISRANLRAIVDNTMDSIWSIDRSFRIVTINERFKAEFKDSQGTVLQPGTQILDYSPEELRPVWRERYERTLSGEQFTVMDKISVRGVTRHLEISFNPIRTEDGKVAGAAMFSRDITERRAAELALRESEAALAAETERLSVTLRSIGDGVITTDAVGRILFVNREAERLTGWTQTDCQGKPIGSVFSLINERTRKKLPDPVTRIVSSRIASDENEAVLLTRKDGSEILVSDSGAPILDKDSKIIGVVLVFRDITEKRRAEEERVKTMKLESVGILAGGIAHDFNNLLTAILGNLSLAKMELREGRGERAREILSRSEAASLRARDLTHQLLTFSKGGAPVRRVGSVVQLIKESAEFMSHGSKVKPVYDVAENLWPIDADQGQITQVIHNLVINAIQAMPDGGELTVTARNANLTEGQQTSLKTGSYIEISVADRGAGIQKDIVNKIFDPYFTTKETGSGLGLATCYSIVKNHGGAIDVKTREGEGSTFTVYFPAITEGGPMMQDVEHAAHAGKGSILIMDDEPEIQEITKRILNRLGYEAKATKEGNEAIEAYAKAAESGHPFDAVILDLTVPGGLGGKETSRRILAMDPEARIIVASGYSNDPVMADHKAHGFKGVISKPFRMEDLQRVLAEIMRAK